MIKIFQICLALLAPITRRVKKLESKVMSWNISNGTLNGIEGGNENARNDP